MYTYSSRCVGLPGGPCPKNRHDRSVQNGIGDLMLCPDCDRVRREEDRLLHQSTHFDKTKEQTTAAVTTNGARAASLRQTASHTASVLGSQSHATTGPVNDADTASNPGLLVSIIAIDSDTIGDTFFGCIAIDYRRYF